jgi:hypothetical protein
MARKARRAAASLTEDFILHMTASWHVGGGQAMAAATKTCLWFGGMFLNNWRGQAWCFQRQGRQA